MPFERHKKLGDTFTVIDPALIAVTYSRDQGEVQYLAQYLRDEGLIKHMVTEGITEITPAPTNTPSAPLRA